MQYTKIYQGARVIGEVRNGAFCKSIKGSTGMLHRPRAIAFSVSSLQDAKAAGADRLKILDRETGAIYETTFTHFDHYSFEIQRGGYEAQKALPLSYWNVSGGTVAKSAVNVTPAPKYESTNTPAPEYKPSEIQLSLFAGM